MRRAPPRASDAASGQLSVMGLARLLLRESRGNRGRLVFFVLCLSVGVAAVVAVKAMSASLDAGVRSQARELIAADILISARKAPEGDVEPIWDKLEARFPGFAVAEFREMLSVVASQREVLRGSVIPGLPSQAAAIAGSQITELKAVSPGYPYYGTADVEPVGALNALFDDRKEPGVLVAPELLERLQLSIGDVLLVGGSPFRIRGVIRAEPDRVAGALSFAPRAMVSLSALQRTRALTDVSRASYGVQVRVPDQIDVDAVAAVLTEELSAEAGIRIETYREARPQLREALVRVSAFLGLVALLSLLIGGVGVSQTVRAWLATRWDQIAILKSLGLRPREVMALYVSQVVLLAAVGSAVGAVLGAWLQLLVPRLFGEIIPAGMIRAWQPWPIAQGFLLGTTVALAFSVPPLLVVLRVPAARVLRRDSDPIESGRWVNVLLGVAVIGVVFAVASLQAVGLPYPAPLIGAAFTAALLLTVACLVGASLVLVRTLGRGRRTAASSSWQVAVRYGTASVARPGSGALAAIVSLGLGLLVVLTMILVEGALTDRLQADLPIDAPSMFLMGIEERQWLQLEGVLENAGRDAGSESERLTGLRSERTVKSVPVLGTVVELIDGESIEQRLAGNVDDERRWATRRQLRVAPLAELPDGNTLQEGGAWFTNDGRWEASVEREYAESLGVGVGSTLTLRVESDIREFVITSLRTVDWESFSINFWVVVEPGAFATDAIFRLATVRAERDEEQVIQDMTVAQFPNVTVIRVREALDRIVEIFGRLGLGIKFLGGFTVVAGLVILGGSVAATAARRGREAALLKSLGMVRAQVLLAFGTEYALLGLVASVVAVLGACAISFAAAHFLLEVDWSFRPLTVLAAIVTGVTLAVLGGTLASLQALRRRPIESLRSES